MIKKFLILIFLIINIIYACDGDCVKCHPILIKSGHLDNNHKILKDCINCHKTTSNDLDKMGSLCGQDCWECHNMKKVMKIPIKEHFVLSKCIKCHKKLNKEQNLKNFLTVSKKIPIPLGWGVS